MGYLGTSGSLLRKMDFPRKQRQYEGGCSTVMDHWTTPSSSLSSSRLRKKMKAKLVSCCAEERTRKDCSTRKHQAHPNLIWRMQLLAEAIRVAREGVVAWGN